MSDVLIILFAGGGYDKAAQGLAGAGRRLAEGLGGRLLAAVVGAGGDALARELARVADAVTVADQAELAEYQPETCLAALASLCGEARPRAVLLGNDTYSQEVAPRLAHRLGGSAVGDGVEVRVEGEELRVSRQVYGGKAQAVIELKRSPAVVWLRARSFAPAAPRAEAAQVTRAALDLPADARTRIVERKRAGGGESRLEEARVIVSGGRGIGGPEPFETELKPLAELLGAQLAASRTRSTMRVRSSG